MNWRDAALGLVMTAAVAGGAESAAPPDQPG
jgi:hypothetical protein